MTFNPSWTTWSPYRRPGEMWYNWCGYAASRFQVDTIDAIPPGQTTFVPLPLQGRSLGDDYCQQTTFGKRFACGLLGCARSVDPLGQGGKEARGERRLEKRWRGGYLHLTVTCQETCLQVLIPPLSSAIRQMFPARNCWLSKNRCKLGVTVSPSILRAGTAYDQYF